MTLLMPLLIAGAGCAISPGRDSVRVRSGDMRAPVYSTVFESGEKGYRCYRIPAIVATPQGELLAFAEARRADCGDFGDVEIVMKRSRDHGRTWGESVLVADFGEFQAGNPAPVYDLLDSAHPGGRLFLFYNTGTVPENEVRRGVAIREVWYRTSTDHGRSWSAPINVTTQANRPRRPSMNVHYDFAEDWRSYANTPGHAIQLGQGPHRGRIYVPANHSFGPPQPNFRDYRAHGFFSDDHGRTFQLSGDIDHPGSNESTAAEISNGGLLINCRNQSGDTPYRLQARSIDGGRTWSPAVAVEDLPDPVCEGSLLGARTERGESILLFSNINHRRNRENLTVRVSRDDGFHWREGRSLYSGSSAYSDLVVQSDGSVGVLFEKDEYQRVTFASFGLGWLIQP